MTRLARVGDFVAVIASALAALAVLAAAALFVVPTGCTTTNGTVVHAIPPEPKEDEAYAPVLAKWSSRVNLLDQFQKRIEADAVLLCNAHDAQRLLGSPGWPLQRLRGQTTLLPADLPGLPRLPLPLADGGYAHKDTMTVTGRTFGEEAADAVETPGQEVIHPLSNPIKAHGGLAILKGNLAIDGCVIKTTGITYEIMRVAFEQARKGRMFILDKMNAIINTPRGDLAASAPRIITLQIPVDKIGALIGPGGKTIRGIIETTGATVDVEDDGRVFVTTADGDAAKKAVGMIEALTREIKVGEIFLGKVVKIGRAHV